MGVGVTAPEQHASRIPHECEDHVGRRAKFGAGVGRRTTSRLFKLRHCREQFVDHWCERRSELAPQCVVRGFRRVGADSTDTCLAGEHGAMKRAGFGGDSVS